MLCQELSSSAERDPSRQETQILETDEQHDAAVKFKEGPEEETTTDDVAVDPDEQDWRNDPNNFGSPCQPHSLQVDDLEEATGSNPTEKEDDRNAKLANENVETDAQKDFL